MKKFFALFLVAGFAFLSTGVGMAQDQTPGTRTPVIRKRQVEQQRRIRRGIRSGELTRGEVKTIEKNQREIQQDKREAKSDGTVTAAERREIRQDQNKASRQIYRKKHNNRDRKP